MPFISDNDLKQKQNVPSQLQQPSTPGIMQNIGSSLQKRGSEFMSNVKELGERKIVPVEFGIRQIGTGIGAATDIIGDVIAPIIRPSIEKIFATDAGKDLAYALKNGVETYNEFKNSSPTAKRVAKDFEAIVNIGGIAPIVKGTQIVGKTAVSGVSTVGKTIGKGVATTGRVVEKAGDIIHGATPAFKPGIGEARKLIKESAKTTFSDKVKGVLTGEPMKDIVTGGAVNEMQTVAKTAKKYGISGITESGVATQAERVRRTMWDKTIQPAMSKIKDDIYIGDVFKNVSARLQKVADPTELKELRDGLKAVFEDYGRHGKMTIEQADNLKSSLARKLPQKVWNGKDVTGVTNTIRYEMSNELRNLIANKLPKQIKEAYYDYGNLKTIIDRGAASLTKSYQEGGFGKVVGKVLKTVETPITTYGGRAIQKAGKILQRK